MSAAPIRYPRGRVTGTQELCLQQNKEFLLGEIVCQDIVINLRSKFILNASDNDFILGVDGNRFPLRDQNSRLIDTITMRSSKGFEAFLQALIETGHEEAYRRMTETLETLPAGVENVHIRRANSTSASASITDENEEVFSHQPTYRSLSSQSCHHDDVTRRLVERVQEAGEMVRQITKHLSFGSDQENPSREDSEEDYQEQLSSLCGRVDRIEIRLDGIEGQIGLKGITEEQQNEVDRLKKELESAQAEIRRLLETSQSQESEINAQKEINRQRSEQLEMAKKKIEELLDHIKQLVKENADIKKELQTVQQKTSQAESKLAALETKLEGQQEDLAQAKKQSELARKQAELAKMHAELVKKESDAKLTFVLQEMEKLKSDVQQIVPTQMETSTVRDESPQPQRRQHYHTRARTMQFPGLPGGRASSFQKK